MTAPDAELVARARRGDREAFGRLVDRHSDMVHGLAWHLTGDFEDARDLSQDAFVRAYVRLPQLHSPEKFAGWLRRITANLHRSQARRRSVSTAPLSDAGTPAVEARRSSEIESAVREALARLSRSDRLTLTLHYVNGYSQQEIADFLETKASVIKTRMARARARLTKEMIAMVESTFDERRLPPSFRKDVIAGLDGMVRNLRDRLPPDPERLMRRVHERRNALWREIYGNLPSALRDKVAEGGQARPAPLSAYPPELKEKARQAVCWTWLWDMLRKVFAQLPWTKDINALWVRFRKAEDGTLKGCLADVPGSYGTIFCIHEFLNAPDTTCDVTSVEPDALPLVERDAVQLWRSLNEDILSAAEGVRACLLTVLPAEIDSFRRVLYAETCAAFAAAYHHLPSDFLKRMAQGEGFYDGEAISAREFDDESKHLMERAVTLHSAYRMVAALANPPWCGDRVDEMTVEFGFYGKIPGVPETDPVAGTQYVTLRTTPGAERGSGYQTGISE